MLTERNYQFKQRFLAGLMTLAGSSLLTTQVHAQALWQRIAAAQYTAENNASCQIAKPFYFEVGDRWAVRASGSYNIPDSPLPSQRLIIRATDRFNIASASKLIYAAYLAERLGDTDPSALDQSQMNFSSGYDNMTASGCPTSTVRGCLAQVGRDTGTTVGQIRDGTNNTTLNQIGRFSYNGAHMQVNADSLFTSLGTAYAVNDVTGLPILNPTKEKLGEEIGAVLGFTPGELTYDTPLLSGGARTSAGEYGSFLRRVMKGSLRMGNSGYLGWNQFCTWYGIPQYFPGFPACTTTHTGTAASPLASAYPNQPSYYAWGHWVEAGYDGAFSSPGALGFYPWITADQQFYGVVNSRDGMKKSMDCGRKIRDAYQFGVAQ